MSQTAIEALEQSKKQLAQLMERRTRIQVQVESAKQQLAELRTQAESEFGTVNIGELKRILAERERANTEAMAQFQLAIKEFDGFLTRIEQGLANPESLPEPEEGVVEAVSEAVPTVVTPAAAVADLEI